MNGHGILATSLDLARRWTKKHEGKRLKPYFDTVGVLTVGYGINMEEWPYPIALVKGKISDKDCSEMLTIALNVATGDAIHYFKGIGTLNKVRQAVLVCMAYNIGRNRLKTFKKLHAALVCGDYTEASHQMLDSLWAEQVGQRAHFLAQAMETGEEPDFN